MFQGARFQGQLLGAAGLWLLLSPFVLLHQTGQPGPVSDEIALVSMSTGFLALAFAGSRARHEPWERGVLGTALGIATLGSPWVFGFDDQIVAVLNAGITGVAIVLVAVAGHVLGNRPGRI